MYVVVQTFVENGKEIIQDVIGPFATLSSAYATKDRLEDTYKSKCYVKQLMHE